MDMVDGKYAPLILVLRELNAGTTPRSTPRPKTISPANCISPQNDPPRSCHRTKRFADS
jgi:hypothetical protein